MSNLIAKELDIKEIIIPPYSGNFSAWGLLGADLLQMNAKTKILRLSDDAINECNIILEKLFSDLENRQKINFDTLQKIKEISLDMRWMGQEHTISLKLDNDNNGKIESDVEAIKKMFTEDYEKTFGSKLDTIIEIVSVRAGLRVPLPRKSDSVNIKEEDIDENVKNIQCFSFAKNSNVNFEIISRSKITEKKNGPLIILESTSVTYVDTNYTVHKDKLDNLIITDEEL